MTSKFNDIFFSFCAILVLLSNLNNIVIFLLARPDFAELDVFLSQHIFLTLEQHFNPKI